MKRYLWAVACVGAVSLWTWAATDMNNSEENRRMIALMEQKLDSLNQAQKGVLEVVRKMDACNERIKAFQSLATANDAIHKQIEALDAKIAENDEQRIVAMFQRDDSVLNRLIPEVVNAPYDPAINSDALSRLKAVNVAGDNDKAALVKQYTKTLNAYSNYASSLSKFLKSKESDLVMYKWERRDEKWCDNNFMQGLKKTSYFKIFDTAADGSIPFMNKAYDKVIEMKEKGFEHCEEEYKNVLSGDTTAVAQVMKNLVLCDGKIELKQSAINALKTQRDSLARLVVVADSSAYQHDRVELETLKSQVDEKQLEALKKEIIDLTDNRDYYVTREYFSNLRRHPYNKQRLEEGLAKVKETVTTPDLLQYVSENEAMLRHYPDYATELANALDGDVRTVIKRYKCFELGDQNNKLKAKLHDPVGKTAYWPIYQKSKKGGSSILYLDDIAKEIEAMEAVSYKGCEQRLDNVITKLRDCAAGTLPFE